MKYYYIYEFFFPTFLAFVAAPFIFVGLTGVVGRKPIVYSALINAVFLIFIGVPVFFLSLNHLITEPIASTWRCWLLNFSGVVGIPLIIAWALAWSGGIAVFGRTRGELTNDIVKVLSARVERTAWWGVVIRRGDQELRLVQLPATYLAILRAPGLDRAARSTIVEELSGSFTTHGIRSSTRPFVAMLSLGVVLAGTSFGTWCVATQCLVV